MLLQGFNMEFILGDIVRLKSGGPRMTVEAVEERGGKPSVSVVWFERVANKQVVQRNMFPPAILDKVDPNDTGVGMITLG